MLELLTLILVLAVIGFCVYLIVTYIPMPQPFQQVIIVIVVIAILIWLLAQLSGGVPRFPTLKSP